MADIPLRFLSSSHGARCVRADRRSDSCVVSNARVQARGAAAPASSPVSQRPRSSGWTLVPRAMQGSAAGMAAALHVAKSRLRRTFRPSTAARADEGPISACFCNCGVCGDPWLGPARWSHQDTKPAACPNRPYIPRYLRPIRRGRTRLRNGVFAGVRRGSSVRSICLTDESQGLVVGRLLASVVVGAGD
jgi:hypothetical protein